MSGERDREPGAGHDDRGRAQETPTSSYAEWFALQWAGTVRGHRVRCPYDDPLRRAMEAMGEAGARYPGPVAELIRREIRAFVDFGYRGDGTGLVPRLVDELLGSRDAGHR